MIRALVKGFVGGVAARFVNLAAMAIVVPIALAKLGTVAYGVYAMAMSVGMLTIVADLGFGMSIVSEVAKINSQNRSEILNKISRLWWTLLFIAVVFSGLIGALYLVAPKKWGWMDGNSVAMSSGLAAQCLLLGVAPGLYQRVAFARQQNAHLNINTIIGRLLSVVIIVLFEDKIKTAEELILITLGVPTIVSWLYLIVYFWIDEYKLKPLHFKVVGFANLSDVKIGSKYLGVQCASFMEVGIDTYMVGSIIGSKDAAAYDIITKLYMYLPVFINLVALPFWPILTKSVESRGKDIIKKSRRISYIATIVVATLIMIPGIFWRKELVYFWVKKEFDLDVMVCIGVAAYVITLSVGMFQSALMNSLGLIDRQFRAQLVMLFIVFPVKIFILSSIGLKYMPITFAAIFVCKFIYLEFELNEKIKNEKNN